MTDDGRQSLGVPRPKTQTRDAVHSVDRDLAVLRVEVEGIERRVDVVEEQAAAANAAAVAANAVKPVPWTRVLAIVIPFVFGSGAIVAALSRNPNREEFDAAGASAERRFEQLRDQVRVLSDEAIKVRQLVEELRRDQDAAATAQGRFESKLDALIRRGR